MLSLLTTVDISKLWHVTLIIQFILPTCCLITRYAYKAQGATEVRVARIFNTFGPRMHPNDGRVVSNFIIQVK